MTADRWLAVLAYVALTVAAGGVVLRLLRVPGDSLVHNWGGWFLGGQLVLTAVALTTAGGPWTLGQALVALVVATVCGVAASAWNTWRRRGSGAVGPAARALVREGGLLIVALLAFPNLVMLVHHLPVVDWDGRSIWFFHGKALYFGGGVDADFFTDPRYWWSNPDYPLLIPAQAAWCAELMGGWKELGVRAFLLFDFAALLRVLAAVLAAKGHRWWIALTLAAAVMVAAPPRLTLADPYVAGGADMHYVLPLVTAFLAASVRPRHRAVPLILLLLAFAANVKNEAFAYVTLLVATSLLVLLWQGWRQGSLREQARRILAHRRTLLVLGTLGAAPLVLWTAFKARHGITGNLHLLERLTTPGLPGSLLEERAKTVLAGMADAYHSGLSTPVVAALWLLLLAIALVVARRNGRSSGLHREELATLLFFLAVNALVFGVYVMTPHDVEYHMKTSVGRLLYLPHFLVVALCVFRIDLPLRGTTTTDPVPVAGS